jgi:voltage-gated potassium channel
VENKFSYMLIALLIFLIGVPVATDLHLFTPGIIRAIGFSMLLIIGVWSLKGSGRWFSIAVAFVCLGIILNALYEFQSHTIYYVSSALTTLAYLSLATAHAFRQIVVSNNISANRIVGAICVYLLIGVIWSLFYSLLEVSVPGSFKGLMEQSSVDWSPDWVYYSFVTLSTLGYGDITPLTFSARALSYFEAIVGQFYLAIMVAGLVGAYLSNNQGQAPKQ